MGTPTVLGKITTAIAIVFMLTSFGLALLGGERRGSVIRESAPVSTPATPAPATPEPAAPASKAPAAPTTPAPAPAEKSK